MTPDSFLEGHNLDSFMTNLKYMALFQLFILNHVGVEAFKRFFGKGMSQSV